MVQTIAGRDNCDCRVGNCSCLAIGKVLLYGLKSDINVEKGTRAAFRNSRPFPYLNKQMSFKNKIWWSLKLGLE